jgi:hypothetical protein
LRLRRRHYPLGALLGGAVDTPVNLAGSDEDTLVVEDGVIVLRGDVESDDE